mgnify:CR=1 FL=1
MQKKKLIVFIFVLVLLGISLHIFTGFFSGYERIDERDANYWNYTQDGLIEGAGGFEINGSKDVCWLLVHSYCATPLEMRELSSNISNNFGDYVKVLRLKGHGRVPSKIINLSIKDWYKQTDSEYENMKLECNKINVLGSSYGGTIALNLAKEHSHDEKFNHLYVLNGYLGVGYKWYYILEPNYYISLFSDSWKYVKKTEIALINSEQGKNNHVAYWNMPLTNVKNSINFVEKSKKNVSKINSPALFLHSREDGAASYKLVENIYSNINSTNKKIKYFDASNHILLMDYNKSEVIESVIEFEKKIRK